MSDIQGLGQLGAPRAVGSEPISPEEAQRIRALAAEFESLLLSQLLKGMRSSMLGDDKDTGFASNPLSDTMFSELSLALSRAGGIGIADSLLAPMLRQQADVIEAGPAIRMPDTQPALATSIGTSSPGHRDEAALDVPAVLREQFGGRISSAYGWRDDPINGQARFHAGTDIALPVGQDVPVARAGKVTFAGELPGYGLTVLVEHDGQMATRYAHLSEISVRQGEAVQAGQTIAKSGATGRVTGPHLHFEVLEAGKPVNPQELYEPAPAAFGQSPKD